MHTTLSTGHVSFRTLLASYLTGQIGERAWQKLMKTFDATKVTTKERLAYARFMSDFVTEGSVKLNVPAPEELEELFDNIRQDRQT